MARGHRRGAGLGSQRLRLPAPSTCPAGAHLRLTVSVDLRAGTRLAVSVDLRARARLAVSVDLRAHVRLAVSVDLRAHVRLAVSVDLSAPAPAPALACAPAPDITLSPSPSPQSPLPSPPVAVWNGWLDQLDDAPAVRIMSLSPPSQSPPVAVSVCGWLGQDGSPIA